MVESRRFPAAPSTAPVPHHATRRAESELARCLGVLTTLFPDAEFKQNPPDLKIQAGYPPLPEQPFCNPRSHLITLYRTDLNRPVSDILTILLHQAVHVANAFAWRRDCNPSSYHNEQFRRLAEKVGLKVHRISRYGWANTVPRCWLLGLFRSLELSEEVLGPFRDRLMLCRKKKIWHCGLTGFPERGQLQAMGVTSPPPSRLPRSRLQGMNVHSLWHGSGHVPMVRLSGNWLRAFGFRERVRMKVEARYGQLTLQVRDPGNEDRPQKTAVPDHPPEPGR